MNSWPTPTTAVFSVICCLHATVSNADVHGWPGGVWRLVDIPPYSGPWQIREGSHAAVEDGVLFFYDTMIKPSDQKHLRGGKGLCQLTGYHLSLREVRAGSPDRKPLRTAACCLTGSCLATVLHSPGPPLRK